jgi:lipopolysaccharide export system permease protein
VVAYHKVNQYAQDAATNGQVNAIVALWIPLVLLAAMIMWMYHILAHKPGGQPIGALEWFFAKTAKRAKALLPKPREVRSGA